MEAPLLKDHKMKLQSYQYYDFNELKAFVTKKLPKIYWDRELENLWQIFYNSYYEFGAAEISLESLRKLQLLVDTREHPEFEKRFLNFLENVLNVLAVETGENAFHVSFYRNIKAGEREKDINPDIWEGCK